MSPTSEKSMSSGEKGQYKCKDCHEVFSVKRKLATHMKTHDGNEPHSCTQCGKEFGTWQLLKQHSKWHNEDRTHVCPHCDKAYFEKHHLNQHLMVHSGVRPHECPQCHRTFAFKFRLTRHIKDIHQEHGFSCQQCGRSFLKQVMLDEHYLKCKEKPSSPLIRLFNMPKMKAGSEAPFSVKPSSETHVLGEKERYECKDCNQMFAVGRELPAHMMIHSGEQPHSCAQCGKEFGTLSLLKQHLRYHSEYKPLVCPQCNKGFLYNSHLTQHLTTHSGDRQHGCPHCYKIYKFKSDLNRHIKKSHQKHVSPCQQCGKSFLEQVMLDEHHLKCKGKPSSPFIRLFNMPKMKAGSEAPSSKTHVLSPETIEKMNQIQLIQPQENQKNALNRFFVDNILNDNNDYHIVNGNKNGGIGGFEVPAPAMLPNLTCMLCKIQFDNQYSFALHMYTYHLANQNTILSHHQITSIGNQYEPTPLGSTVTSYAPDLQKTPPLQLLESSCFGQNSVSPLSSSRASPQSTASEYSSTTSSCKDYNQQKAHDLEQQVSKKNEEFENYRQMTSQIISNVFNFLTTSATPENMFMANVLKQLKNTL